TIGHLVAAGGEQKCCSGAASMMPSLASSRVWPLQARPASRTGVDMPSVVHAVCFCLTVLVAGCGDNSTPSNVTVPGDAMSAKTKALEAAAGALQGQQPLEMFNVYMDGFHFYSGNVRAQMEAH